MFNDGVKQFIVPLTCGADVAAFVLSFDKEFLECLEFSVQNPEYRQGTLCFLKQEKKKQMRKKNCYGKAVLTYLIAYINKLPV